jgi:biotin carboxyl carrier protein
MAETVIAPMVGKILAIDCKVGDKVAEDDVLLTMEAMKMEIPVVAPAGGTVKEIKVAVGESVDADAPLLVIE